ncbi:MAG TPA: hypothetical protein VG674_07850 [Amycolatopsis sp.]|nr:hypothetical protein [Amycolatopsis sp.]
MTGPIRSLAAFVGLAALACALTACDGSSVGGTPAPATSSSSAPSSSAGQSNTPLAGLSPCKTLDQALAGQGYPAATPDIADPEHVCDAQKPGQDDYLGLGLQDGQRYDTSISNPEKTQKGNVRDRRAILEPEPNHGSGICAVSIEVKPESRAIVSASLASGTTDQACTAAENLAAAVELLLPKTN